MPRFCPRFARLACAVLAMLVTRTAATAASVSFSFAPPANAADPFARELFAEVRTPSGATLLLPAFVDEDGAWTVRARADAAGEFRLGRIVERTDGATHEISAAPRGPAVRTVTQPSSRLAVGRSGTGFRRTDGSPYVPIGANLAWAPRDRVKWHVDALRQFGEQDLNWTRIWMCHWGGANLDWLPEDMGRSPAPGRLDARVAAAWDRIITAAEENGVHVQLVLQHHGQYSSTVNSNWAQNPWNAAHPGGFLQTPGEFFTSPRAIALTKQKYRYIVARWAHSPAILAWELFNEVHWTDACRHDGNDAAVASWHAEMAACLRSIDPYGHLITTSLDDIHSPIYAAMDYLQPHLYAVDMLAGVRRFGRPFDEFDRPVFYGEIGDDKMPVTDAEKSAGVQLAPQVWASLMGPGSLPGQSWLGASFLQTRRLGELGAVARFLAATGLAVREGLAPFSPAVEGATRMPLVITPGHEWERHVPAAIDFPLDGRAVPEAADIPGFLVGAPASVADGFPRSTTLRLDLPRDTTAAVTFADAGARGATVEVRVDGAPAAAHTWPRLTNAPAAGPQPPDTPARPATLTFPIAAGERALEIRNTGGADWVRLGSIDLQLDVSVLAAAGKRRDDFVALWIWDRRSVHALKPAAPAAATLVLDDLPAGDWKVTWWDAVQGEPRAVKIVSHAGGTLRLATPPISRHAAVVLTR